jgi:hypothetical protein
MKLFVYCTAVAVTGVSASIASAQMLEPPFDTSYSLVDLGVALDVPLPYGGLVFKFDDPNVLLIAGSANNSAGAVFAISVVRRAGDHRVTGFTGTSTRYSDGPNNDGGVVYGPSNVLFIATYPNNHLLQLRPGSATVNRDIDLTPLGVESSVGSINFVPAGVPGAGRFKILSYSSGQWTDGTVTPDGSGTFTVSSMTNVEPSRLPVGPEGFVYVHAGSPQFSSPGIICSEYGRGDLAAYSVNSTGDPDPSTRRIMVSGLDGAEGATLDPVTGDYLFSTFGGNNRVIAVRGLRPPCRVDLNNDGFIDIRDFLAFLQLYSQNNLQVDWDASGAINVADFLAYLQSYSAGCG